MRDGANLSLLGCGMFAKISPEEIKEISRIE